MEFDVDKALDVVTRKLPEAGVDAIMIGGHAVNTYGVSRATQDIDFMIAATDEETVRGIMSDAGFTNIAAHETVIFFSRPDSPLRVDFLKVDSETMEKLLANSREVDYFEGYKVRVPRLQDLLAMKLFALAGGGAKREEKDFSDIVNLVLENNFDLDEDLRPLCLAFASQELYERISSRIRELDND